MREETYADVPADTNTYRHLRIADFSDTVPALPPEELQVGACSLCFCLSLSVCLSLRLSVRSSIHPSLLNPLQAFVGLLCLVSACWCTRLVCWSVLSSSDVRHVLLQCVVMSALPEEQHVNIVMLSSLCPWLLDGSQSAFLAPGSKRILQKAINETERVHMSILCPCVTSAEIYV